MARSAFAWVVSSWIVLGGGLAQADESHGQGIAIRGYGGWAYGKTDVNAYLDGAPRGVYQNFDLGVGIYAAPLDNVRVNVLPYWGHSTEGDEMMVDFAFVEWRLSESLALRIGRARPSFGAYSEIVEVGTLRPFYSLPQGLYGPSGLLAEHYQGLGVTGVVATDGGWGVRYDLYGGAMPFEGKGGHAMALAEADTGSVATEEASEDLADMIGARLALVSPVFGLGASIYGYSGRVDAPGTEFDRDRRTAYGASLEYVTDVVHLRSEAARALEPDVLTVDAFYVEAAYRLLDDWQIAARYDWARATLGDAVDTSEAPSLLEHQDAALSLNYWAGGNFVIKLSYHHVTGNLFAAPVERHFEEVVAAGALEDTTQLVELGAQFSF